MDHTGFIGTTTPGLKGTAAHRATSLRPSSSSTVLPQRASAFVSSPSLRPDLSPSLHASGHLHDNGFGKGTGTVIVLFRADLRLDDHPALSHAVEDAACVVPVYCFDPRHFGRTEYGFEKTGRYRAKFLLESVADLRESLQEMGSDILVRLGKPEEVVPELCRKLGAKKVFVHREVTYDEQQVEAALAKNLKKQGMEMTRFWSNTLYHEDDLPFELSSMPDVYSDFREAVDEKGTIRVPLPPPDGLPRLPSGSRPGEIPTLSALGISGDFGRSATPPAATGVSSVTGGEKEAIQRVRSYVKEARRFDHEHSPRSRVTANLGADFSCRISPWLALGCISARRIFDEVKKVSARPDLLLKSSTYFELVWRDFFRCITAKYSSKRSNSGSRSRTVNRRRVMVGA